jgi:hypothetical protein
MLDLLAVILALAAIVVSAAALRLRMSAPFSSTREAAAPVETFWRSLLVLYLLLFGTGLLLGLLNLWSAEPVPNGTLETQTPKIAPPPNAPPGTPVIDEVNPANVIVTTIPPMLTIRGHNFTNRSTVLLDTSDRKPRYVNPTVLLLPLTATDVGQPASMSLRIVQDDIISNPVTIQIQEKQFCLRFWPGGKLNEETRLLVLVLFAGALGAYIHALKSLVDYIGNRTYTTSWTLFYITRPFLGTALAVVFYAVIRGGFLVGTPADVKSVNPFGVIALSGLVGMFADKATQKLAEVFDTMFKTEDKRKDRLSGFRIATDARLPDATKGKEYTADLKAEGGQQPYTWSLKSGPDWLHIDSHTGKLTGTPDREGEAQAITVSVSDVNRSSLENKFLVSVKPGANAPGAPEAQTAKK